MGSVTDSAQIGRLRRALAQAQARAGRLEDRIQALMTQRADCEEHQAEIMGEIQRLGGDL